MFSKSLSVLVPLALLAISQPADARIRWAERDGRAILLHPRRFGQEHPAVIDKLSSACAGEVCGVLAGQAITPLLAAQGECTQQDMADAIINASRQFDAATQANMIALAQEYRQAEKNTPPDFSVQPNTLRNSVFCQKAPQNSELDGLVQAQDPANDPNAFFDPALGKTVQLGSQANTFPFGSSGNGTSTSNASAASASVSAVTVSVTAASPTATANVLAAVGTACPTAVTVTVTNANAVSTAPASSAAAATSTSAAAVATSTAAASDIGNFGSCSIPQIEFGVGFDNRKETSFQPVDKTSFNHGSAQNIDIITQAICDTLTNSCGADATAKATCAKAQAAADTVTAKTGGQADAFNAVFGIKTDFAAVASVDDQGNVIAGTGSSSTGAAATTTSVAAATTAAAATTSAAAVTTSAAAVSTTSVATTTGSTSTTASGSVGNFGTCSTPQIEFGVGFDGRKETSFQPVDKASFNHGSADGIDIITSFICSQLASACKADATAQATCKTATAAADAAAKGTGAQADAFNAAFGVQTDFASVTEVDNQGKVVAGTGSGASTSTAVSTSGANNLAVANATSGSIGNFGSCSIPQIEFGVGFDNRKETSFQPVDKTSFNHGSAQNIDIITQAICDTLTNSCGADATAKATCAKAQAAADTVTAKTGGQADAFNAVFGIKTDFAAVASVDDQGRVVAGTGSA